MSELLIEIGQWFRPYQYQSALAIIATTLVIFGHNINQLVKQLVKRQHFIIRSIVFILVCAFGYGLLTVWLTQWLTDLFAQIPDRYIAPVIVAAFLMLSAYAQRQKHI